MSVTNTTSILQRQYKRVVTTTPNILSRIYSNCITTILDFTSRTSHLEDDAP